MEVEINGNLVKDNPALNIGSKMVVITPPINESYWMMRVKLSEDQAVVCFPKFFTIGIGFQKEEDWNTNLPYSCEAKEIFDHISHNKGDESISDEDCIKAISMLQEQIQGLDAVTQPN